PTPALPNAPTASFFSPNSATFSTFLAPPVYGKVSNFFKASARNVLGIEWMSRALHSPQRRGTSNSCPDSTNHRANYPHPFMTTDLKLFSDPYVLRQAGRPLLTRFFERFTHLLPSKHFLPNPRPDNDAYFDSLALVLERTCELPDALLQALLEIETLALPENQPRLQATLESDFEPTDATPLSQAIRAWLHLAEASTSDLRPPTSDLSPVAHISASQR